VRLEAPDSCPLNTTRPVVGTKPVTPSMNEVLPAPFGPISPTSEPGETWTSTSLTARMPPKVTDIS
jgi:hypothetical protein